MPPPADAARAGEPGEAAEPAESRPPRSDDDELHDGLRSPSDALRTSCDSETRGVRWVASEPRRSTDFESGLYALWRLDARCSIRSRRAAAIRLARDSFGEARGSNASGATAGAAAGAAVIGVASNGAALERAAPAAALPAGRVVVSALRSVSLTREAGTFARATLSFSGSHTAFSGSERKLVAAAAPRFVASSRAVRVSSIALRSEMLLSLSGETTGET